MKLPAGYYEPKLRHPGAVNLPRRGRSGLQRQIQRMQAQTGQPVYLFPVGRGEGILRSE